MERRNFITHASATLAGAAVAACGGGNAADNQGKPTFVFVHGAWHGAWCFSRVAQLLAEQGYQSLLVDLPGHGMQALLPNAYTSKPQDIAGLAMELSPLASLSIDDYRNAVLAIRGLVAAGTRSFGAGPRTTVTWWPKSASRQSITTSGTFSGDGHDGAILPKAPNGSSGNTSIAMMDWLGHSPLKDQTTGNPLDYVCLEP
jgi:hypothetical protein